MLRRRGRLTASLSRRQMASDTLPPTTKDGSKPRQKVQLKPGFHLTDWMNLSKTSDFSTRNGGPMKKVSTAELAIHKSQFDCWTAYNGKVYNITQYMHYHPGGIQTLMSGAGKDCTKAFNKFHPWVNIETILAKCCVGILMADEKAIVEENEEEDGGSDQDSGEKLKVPEAVFQSNEAVNEMFKRAREQLSLDEEEEKR